MHIRLLEPTDTPSVKALWRISFPEDSAAFVDWFFQTRYRPENTWGVFSAGQLVANLQAIPQSLCLRGKTLPVHMIVGAATHPDARRKGHMRRLIRHVFGILRDRHPASILYPFRFSFYRQMGYATISERIWSSVPLSALPSFPVPNVHTMDSKQFFANIPNIQESFCARFDGHPLPSSDDYRFRFQEFQIEQAEGMMADSQDWYAYFSQKNSICTIHQMAYTSFYALKSCLSALAHFKQPTRILFPLPRQDSLYEWLSDARGLYSLEPFLMLRILNIPAFLTGMQCVKNDKTVIQVDDPFLETSTRWQMDCRNEQILRVTAVPFSHPADVRLSMLDFTRWACGIVSVSDLDFEGVEHAEALSFLAPQNNYFYDMY